MKTFLLWNIYLLSLVGLASDQPEPFPVQLTATVDQAVATTSTEITFTVTLTTIPEYKSLKIPEFGDSIRGFRVIDFGNDLGAKNDDGQWVKARWYKLKADVSGSYLLPSVTVTYKDSQDRQQQATTSEIFVEINSKGQEDASNSTEGKEEDIRDIKSLQSTPVDPIVYLLLGIIVGVLFLFGVIYYLVRRKGKQEAPKEPPETIALEKLAQLKTANLLTEGRVKEFHFKVSETLRNYIEDRYHFPASDRTNEEIKDTIHTIPLNEEQKSQFLDILSETDIVKFTDFNPGHDRSLQILAYSEKFVENTKPQRDNQESVV